jgi:EAL domain-containing protein (putative c-di-GMP-specific phosphodiesterase class I)
MASPTVPAFTMAFQPIVDADQRAVFAYEALVRGLEGEGALEVLGQVGPEQRFAFHEACRMRAIELAARLGMRAKLSLNVMPNDVAGQERCFRSAMAAAARFGFPVEQLMFELTEGERVQNLPGLAASFKTFKCYGFTSAIDDFGAAYAGFELLAGFQPDIVKVDMSLVRGVDADPVRLAIVRGFVQTCGELRVRVVAEGIETREELRALRGIGVKLFQGYLFSRPVIASLPPIAWGDAER